MGKGDIKSKRGKLAKGTYGKKRQPIKKRKKKLQKLTRVAETAATA